MSDIRQSIGLPPTETIAFFRAKGYLPAEYREDWDQTWHDEHARWFTVTKLFNNQLLQDVRASLDRVLSEGGTYETWKKGILPKLSAPGATGVDPRLLTSDARLRIVFDTNLRMSRAAGKWKRIQELKKAAPYLMYVAINDGRTRPLHRVWGGLDNGQPVILPVDDPWWDTHFPPCGWNCRCGVTQLSERDLRRQGLSVSQPPKEPPATAYQRTDGTIVSVPAGIDPGFAYNPGKAFVAALTEPPTSGPIHPPRISPDPLPTMPPPRVAAPGSLLPPDADPQQAIDTFLSRFGKRDGAGNVSALDELGEPLLLNESFFYRAGTKGGADTAKLVDTDRVRHIALLADTLADPDEIWWAWEEQKARDGSPAPPRLTRRYVSRVEIDGKVRTALIVMRMGPGGWHGVTAFVGANKRYADKPQVRGGVLAYRRP